jgi:integrase
MKTEELIAAHLQFRQQHVPPLSDTALAHDQRGYCFLLQCGDDTDDMHVRAAHPLIHEMFTANLAPATINEHISHATQCLEWAVTMEMIEKNPLARLKKLKNERRRYRRALSLEEFYALRLAAGDWWRGIVELFVCTGCRRNELRLLEWSEVDLEDRALHLPKERTKTRTARDCLLGPKMTKMLGALPRVSEHVFVPQDREKPYAPGTINARLKRTLCREANVDPNGITTHSLRYTTASFLDDLEVGPREFDLILGHKGGGIRSKLHEVYSLGKNEPMHRKAVERLEKYALS